MEYNVEKLTSGKLIKEARILKNMTINDLAFALDKKNIKAMEKKIKSWEADKSYLTLEEMYQVAYILEINPTDLLVLRERNRKSFVKDGKPKKEPWFKLSEGTKEYLYYLFQFILKVAFFIMLIYFAIKYLQAANVLTVGTDQMILQKMEHDIDTYNKIPYNVDVQGKNIIIKENDNELSEMLNTIDKYYDKYN